MSKGKGKGRRSEWEDDAVILERAARVLEDHDFKALSKQVQKVSEAIASEEGKGNNGF